ncbi:unnamed protein product [Parajaminaea phylloscopi]
MINNALAGPGPRSSRHIYTHSSRGSSSSSDARASGSATYAHQADFADVDSTPVRRAMGTMAESEMQYASEASWASSHSASRHGGIDPTHFKPPVTRTRPSSSRLSSSTSRLSSWAAKSVKAAATAVVVTVLAASLPVAQAGAPNNVTSLAGTWSTGAGHVLTGLKMYNPGNASFNPPATAGQSYSFTDDGFWEQALYLYESNPANPGCVQAQLIWQHGTYTRNANNSLTLVPFKGDGRQQISSRCGYTSSTVSSYTQQEFMQGFEIHLSTHYGNPAYYLQLYEFDGTPKPVMWQRYNPPQMLPTQQLHVEVIGSPAG